MCEETNFHFDSLPSFEELKSKITILPGVMMSTGQMTGDLENAILISVGKKDDKSLRQGLWANYCDFGRVKYTECTYKDDKIVGRLNGWWNDGSLREISIYDENGDVSDTKTYYNNELEHHYSYFNHYDTDKKCETKLCWETNCCLRI